MDVVARWRHGMVAGQGGQPGKVYHGLAGCQVEMDFALVIFLPGGQKNAKKPTGLVRRGNGSHWKNWVNRLGFPRCGHRGLVGILDAKSKECHEKN